MDPYTKGAQMTYVSAQAKGDDNNVLVQMMQSGRWSLPFTLTATAPKDQPIEWDKACDEAAIQPSALDSLFRAVPRGVDKRHDHRIRAR